MDVIEYYHLTEFWKKYFIIQCSIFSIQLVCFVLLDFSLCNKKWNFILQVTDYSRDLEEMQNVSREEYLASLRR